MSRKYVAFTADTEAYFCPPEFEHWQGVFTLEIVNACERHGVPFTWLVIADRERQPREFREIDAIAKTVLPRRKGVDEFGVHFHFNWFINDAPDDFESYKRLERRLALMRTAKERREEQGLPPPVTFRYGGGDMQERFYLAADFFYLHDELGVKNWLFPHELQDVRGLSDIKHLGNNVWSIDGGRTVTIPRAPRASLEKPRGELLAAVDSALAKSDYLIADCHDYWAAVPGNLAAAVEHIRSNCKVEFVTIARIGEMIRAGELRNEF